LRYTFGMFKHLIKHLLIDTLYFPVWWYTAGFFRVLGWAKESLIGIERVAALKIWLKSMFKPMFQDTTRSGRLISFFMRLVLLIFKLLMVIVWAVFLGAILLAWLLLPITIIWLLLKSFYIDLVDLSKLIKGM